MADTSTLYLVRHGETTWNRIGRLQGQADAPLTLRGTRQAHAIGETLRKLIGGGPITIHASPLRRAHQSAVIIADVLGHDADTIRLDRRLVEITLGRNDGISGWAELDAHDPEGAAARKADPWNYVHPEGESSQMVLERVSPWLHWAHGLGGVHVVVSHGVTIKILRGLYLGLTPEQTFALDRPQEAFHRLRAGQVDVIEVDVPEDDIREADKP